MNNQELKKLLNLFEQERYLHYKKQDEAIKDLLIKYPNNKNFLGIMLKVGVINSFYSTNIFKPFNVARKIFSIKDIDKRLEKGDLSLIKEVANVTISGKKKNFYSFATKYCHHHNPKKYVIYDSILEKEIYEVIKGNKSFKIQKKFFRDYPTYLSIFQKFKDVFSLLEFENRDVEKALWIMGKEKINIINSNKKKTIEED